MNCPACNSEDFYEGVFGPNCISPKCEFFQGSKKTSSLSTNKPLYAGEDSDVEGFWWMINEDGNVLTFDIPSRGKMPYYVSKKHPRIVAAKAFDSFFACRCDNTGIGTVEGALGEWSSSFSLESAVERFVKKYGE